MAGLRQKPGDKKSNMKIGLLDQAIKVLCDTLHVYLVNMSGFCVEAAVRDWGLFLPPTTDDLQYELNVIKLLKYKCNAFYSFWTNQSVPTPPFDMKSNKPSVLFGGRVFMAMKRRFHRLPKPRQLSFLMSILQAKKGFERPSEKVVEKGVRDTFDVLTVQQAYPAPSRVSFDWGTSTPQRNRVEHGLNEDRVRDQLIRTVREFFSDVKIDENQDLGLPSTSANYTTARSKLGTYGLAVAGMGMEDPGHEMKREHLRCDESVQVKLKTLVDDEGLVNLDFIAFSTYEVSTNRDIDLVEREISDQVKELARDEMISDINAELVGLAEALKVRTISKGPPMVYWNLQRVQKVMWRQLKRFQPFKFIGTPACAVELQNGIGKPNRGTHNWYLSGDYSQATNLIPSWISELVVNTISDCLGLSSELRREFIAALTGHKISLNEEVKDQKHGQLMGSVVSFPILCLINYALCRWVLELDYGRTFNSRGRASSTNFPPLMINGDDCVLRGSSQLENVWNTLCPYFGFQASPGKCYFSQEFLQINSLTFMITSPEMNIYYDIVSKSYFTFTDETEMDVCAPEGSIMREIFYLEIPFINMGLLNNMTRSSSGGKEESIADQVLGVCETIGSRCQRLVEQAPAQLRETLINEFIKRNKSTLSDKRIDRIPWHLSPVFGGLGLPCSENNVPSNKDRRIAQYMIDHDSWHGKFKSYKQKSEVPLSDLVQKFIKWLPFKPVLCFDEDAHKRLDDFEKQLFPIAFYHEMATNVPGLVRRSLPLEKALAHNNLSWKKLTRSDSYSNRCLPIDFVNQLKPGLASEEASFIRSPLLPLE
jgi:hypothetical protein